MWALAAVAPAAFAVFAGGGYGDGERFAFGALAVVGLAAALGRRPERPRIDPALIVLAVLAALGALSALWTLAPVDRTLAWAAATAGYAACGAAAALAIRRHGAATIAAAVAAIAAVAAAMGLGAALLHDPPWALRVAGNWRPAGPFEYPPALALLQVSALPALLIGMARPSRVVAAASAVGFALAAAVLALAESRTAVALAVVVIGMAFAVPGPTVAARRAVVVSAAALGLVVALAAGALAHGPNRIAAVSAVIVAAPAAWLGLRPMAERLPAARFDPRRGPASAAVAAAALVAGALAFSGDTGRGAGPATDFLHGRIGTWTSAVDAFADRPLTGAGADAFLVASARHQDGQTIRFAHQLPLELGVELGIAGLALALALYAAVAAGAWRARSTPAGWLLGPPALAFLISGLVDWTWHLAGAGAVWALSVGAIAGSGQETDRPRIRSPRIEPRKDPWPVSDGLQSPSPR